MRLFVTGGTGFLGTHFIRAALDSGQRVNALRRPDSVHRLPQHPSLRWVEGTMMSVLRQDLENCEALIHFAAVGVSPQKATVDELFRVNVTESLSLWQNALDAGIRRMVICGSCFEYGRAAERYDRVPADAPLEPVTAYGASKAAGTMAALALASERKCEVIVLRPFTVFGEGQHESNFWPSLRRAALQGEDFSMTAGEQVRDFVSAEVVAQKFIDSLAWKLSPGGSQVANIGSGEPKSLRQFAENWWAQLGATGKLKLGAVPYRQGEVMRYVPWL